MNTNVITLDEANARGKMNWSKENDCEFHGIIPGYVCGFNLEVTKDGKFKYASCVFTNDFEEILNPEDNEYWNDLGISENMYASNGWKSTGNIVFRGYYTEHYDYDEREEYFMDASKEVEDLWKKYVVS